MVRPTYVRVLQTRTPPWTLTRPVSAAHATLATMPLTTISTDDRALVITWSLSVPAQAVWAGFSDPTLLSQWLGRSTECDVRSGGRLVVNHGDGYLSRSAVIEAEEPNRLAMTWEFPDEPESQITINLRPFDEGTVVELSHRGLGDRIGSYGPGWITHLTFLEAALAGVPIPTSNFWKLNATFASLCTARANGSAPVTVSH